jgi:alkylation response protein AidB-like acyl-CoA dehydrogenase
MADTATTATTERAELAEFRSKVRTWLDEHLPAFAGREMAASREFRTALWDAGLLGITLDPAYGGQGLSNDYQRVFSEEARGRAMPPLGEAVTTGICAPTLLDFGTEEQKKRHIPAMIRGEETWTQLLSEPGAGSDLAGLQTKAERDGDEYVITGQKVWTSGAQSADYALCVARTNPNVPKHAGLSMFIVPMQKYPGVTIRPLTQMTGDAHFNEVFLDEVHVPAENLVGDENNGWKALTAMLTHERLALGAGTGAGGSGQAWSRAASQQFIDLARARGLDKDPVVRSEIIEIYILEQTIALMGQKMRDEIAAGINVGSKGSVAKLATAILARRSSNLGMALGGPAAQAWDPSDPSSGGLAMASLSSPMTAIAGGTSEIQRNTIGERVLGLPREPSVDRDIPFKDILQNPVGK